MITKTKQGWHSSLLDDTFETQLAAAHYEDRERKRTERAAESEEEKKLAAMSTEELGRWCNAMGKQVAANTDGGSLQEVHEFISNNPHVSRDGTAAGFDNMQEIRKFLLERGRKYPFSTNDLNFATNHLIEAGKIQIDKKLEAELFDQQLQNDDVKRFRIPN